MGEPGWQAIKNEFGRSVFADDDSLDRKKLGDLVFGNADALNKLNALMRSHIRWAFIKHLLVAFVWRFSRVVIIDVRTDFHFSNHNKLNCGRQSIFFFQRRPPLSTCS